MIVGVVFYAFILKSWSQAVKTGACSRYREQTIARKICFEREEAVNYTNACDGKIPFETGTTHGQAACRWRCNSEVSPLHLR